MNNIKTVLEDRSSFAAARIEDSLRLKIQFLDLSSAEWNSCRIEAW